MLRTIMRTNRHLIFLFLLLLGFLELFVTACAGRNENRHRRGHCAQHSQCRENQACIMGTCESGRLNEPIAYGEIFAEQWFSFPDGRCSSDMQCGPWICEADQCVTPEQTTRDLPNRSELSYFDGSCNTNEDCGSWGCYEGWCRDRELQCGDGIVQIPEQCDDGNLDETDLCRNDCSLPICGDGIISAYEGVQVYDAPIVTNPFGTTGHVCDDGGTTYNNTADVSTSGYAPEHGICQALGAQRALSVTWGDGPGENDPNMPHAYNWACNDFICESDDDYDSDNCSRSEMLFSITCLLIMDERCDDGAANGEPGQCNETCTERVPMDR